MKVLVATRRSQGDRDDDFWQEGCLDGELVWMPEPCGHPVDPDSARHCSCMTGFVGVASDRMTSTIEVRDLKGIGRRAYLSALEGGHLTCCHGLTGVRRHGTELLRIAAGMRTGVVIERWGGSLGLRHDVDGDLKPPLRWCVDTEEGDRLAEELDAQVFPEDDDEEDEGDDGFGPAAA